MSRRRSALTLRYGHLGIAKTGISKHVVHGTVGSVDNLTIKSAARIQARRKLSLKQRTNDFKRFLKQLRSMKYDQRQVRGKIEGLAEYGLFIRLGKMNVVGLLHISAITDEFSEGIFQGAKKGQNVTVQIEEINEVKMQLKLKLFRVPNSKK